MILTENIDIKMNSKWISRYREIGYKCRVGDIISVNILDLPKNSHAIVCVMCDICGNEKNLKYQVYNKNLTKYNFYGCSIKCSDIKYRKTCIEKYGVESSSQSEVVKDKFKKTCIEKFGFSNPNKDLDIRKKISKTNIQRYGCVNPFESQKIKNMIKDSNLGKYGFEYASQSGYVKEKIKKTRIKNGYQIPDELLSEYRIYRRKVDNLTNLIKDEFIRNWDGYDYYDNEFILNNFNYKSNDKRYPHFDHKISVYYGFINGIPCEEISAVNNICLTKGYINSKKCKLTEFEFIKKLDEL